MSKINKGTFFIVLLITLAVAYVALFGLNAGFLHIKGAKDIRLGIDVRGGVEAIYAPTDKNVVPSGEELDSVRSVLETRLDKKNILDREITTDKKNGEVLVRFPWKSGETDFDPRTAVAELGQTALLTFKDPQGNTLIEGKNVKSNSRAVLDSQKNQYVVNIEFDSEGAKLFESATAKLVGQQISIFMDDELISAPSVSQKISGPGAVITGMKTMEDAKALSDKINSGALPFSVEAKNFSTISPTLGIGALNVMIYAGLLTFVLICIFMISLYRLPGVAACIGLTLQISMQLLCLSVPQITLTLPGMAGIILSVGMGVDTNIIISERIKEELNNTRSLAAAIDHGYHRAFSAVLDGNLTTAIVAVILMLLGSGVMLSFGYTLICGVLLNFVSGITASKCMVVSMSKYSGLKKGSLYGQRRVING